MLTTDTAVYRTIQWIAAAVLTFSLSPAHSHLMVAQKGTLNFSGDGAYLLLSLPVSALHEVDDNGDSMLSATELLTHETAIVSQVKTGIQLLEGGRVGQMLTLKGVLLSLSPSDQAPDAPASQLVLMGRYALATPNADSSQTPYALTLHLFGHRKDEQAYDLAITRGSQRQAARFSPARNTQVLFPKASAVFTASVCAGVEHLLSGRDHLLFLLLMLASLWRVDLRWSQFLLPLTCFTAGHAITLATSVMGGFVSMPRLVESAIAATIFGTATLDLVQRRNGAYLSHGARMILIFICAMIHGLGMAGELLSIGVDNSSLVWQLAGFNLGIEAAQVAVATLAFQTLGAIALRSEPAILQRLTHAGLMLGMACGGWWFIQRLTMDA